MKNLIILVLFFVCLFSIPTIWVFHSDMYEWGMNKWGGYPKYVKNQKNGMWAVQTGYGTPSDPIMTDEFFPYFERKKEILYFGKREYIGRSPSLFFREWDAKDLPIKYEYTYSDSMLAVQSYNLYLRNDSIEAWNLARKQFLAGKAADSAFDHDHNYNKK